MRYITLTNSTKAIVDDSDYGWLREHSWYSGKDGRPVGKVNGSPILMYRLIMDAPKGMDVDHINGNVLDNRRANLRICTHAENQRNRKLNKNNKTGFKGVFMAPNGTYRACMRIGGRSVHLGSHMTAEDAARAYSAYAKQFFGDFAKLDTRILRNAE